MQIDLRDLPLRPAPQRAIDPATRAASLADAHHRVLQAWLDNDGAALGTAIEQGESAFADDAEGSARFRDSVGPLVDDFRTRQRLNDHRAAREEATTSLSDTFRRLAEAVAASEDPVRRTMLGQQVLSLLKAHRAAGWLDEMEADRAAQIYDGHLDALQRHLLAKSDAAEPEDPHRNETLSEYSSSSGSREPERIATTRVPKSPAKGTASTFARANRAGADARTERVLPTTLLNERLSDSGAPPDFIGQSERVELGVERTSELSAPDPDVRVQLANAILLRLGRSALPFIIPELMEELNRETKRLEDEIRREGSNAPIFRPNPLPPPLPLVKPQDPRAAGSDNGKEVQRDSLEGADEGLTLPGPAIIPTEPEIEIFVPAPADASPPPNIPLHLNPKDFIEYYPADSTVRLPSVIERRRGSEPVRILNAHIARVIEGIAESLGIQLQHTGGSRDPSGGEIAETYLPNAAGGRKGSSYLDITHTSANGRRLLVNTYDPDVLGDPTTREREAAVRILLNKENGDILVLLPKLKDGQAYDDEALGHFLRPLIKELNRPANQSRFDTGRPIIGKPLK